MAARLLALVCLVAACGTSAVCPCLSPCGMCLHGATADECEGLAAAEFSATTYLAKASASPLGAPWTRDYICQSLQGFQVDKFATTGRTEALAVAGLTWCDYYQISLASYQWGPASAFSHEIAHVAAQCVDGSHATWGCQGFLPTQANRCVFQAIDEANQHER